jgi:RNA 2',3'-cyclic 3'-phosphodiesterase
VRLFTAIELDEHVLAEGATLVAELKQRAQRAAPHARLTWVPTDRMHLTLRFIGQVDDAQAERILHALREPIRIAPFSMTVGGLGTFPPKGPPRVIWLDVGDGKESAIRAEAEVSRRLEALGIPGEARPYKPHLTLARVRETGGLRATVLFDGLNPRLGATEVNATTLFESRLSPKGPAYVALERTPLREDG